MNVMAGTERRTILQTQGLKDQTNPILLEYRAFIYFLNCYAFSELELAVTKATTPLFRSEEFPLQYTELKKLLGQKQI